MKSLIFAFCVVLVWGDLRAQTQVWQPAAGHTQVPIWPRAAPDAQPVPGREFAETTKELFAGKPAVVVNNVLRPTMTVYSPKEKNTRAAVVVFPGGGYRVLAIDLEGTEICDWLASRGIAAVLLKYRVPTPSVGVYRESPPTFLLQAQNDPVDNVNNALVYYIALKNAGVPTEMHLYAQGKHAFGLRRTELPITRWPALAETWLQTIGMTVAERNSPAMPGGQMPPETTKPQRFHLVRRGETLSEISNRYYGSTGQWRKIVEANRGAVKDPNMVRSGTRLIIPD